MGSASTVALFIRASPKASSDMFGNCIHGMQRSLAATQQRRRSSFSVDTQSAAYASLCEVITEGGATWLSDFQSALRLAQEDILLLLVVKFHWKKEVHFNML